MEQIKALLARYATPFFSKVLLRVITYGTAALCAKLAISAPSADVQGQVAEWGATAVAAGLAVLVDYFQHRHDTK